MPRNWAKMSSAQRQRYNAHRRKKYANSTSFREKLLTRKRDKYALDPERHRMYTLRSYHKLKDIPENFFKKWHWIVVEKDLDLLMIPDPEAREERQYHWDSRVVDTGNMDHILNEYRVITTTTAREQGIMRAFYWSRWWEKKRQINIFYAPGSELKVKYFDYEHYQSCRRQEAFYKIALQIPRRCVACKGVYDPEGICDIHKRLCPKDDPVFIVPDTYREYARVLRDGVHNYEFWCRECHARLCLDVFNLINGIMYPQFDCGPDYELCDELADLTDRIKRTYPRTAEELRAKRHRSIKNFGHEQLTGRLLVWDNLRLKPWWRKNWTNPKLRLNIAWHAANVYKQAHPDADVEAWGKGGYRYGVLDTPTKDTPKLYTVPYDDFLTDEFKEFLRSNTQKF